MIERTFYFLFDKKTNLQSMEFSRCMPLTHVCTVREFHTPLIYAFAIEKNHAFHTFSLQIKILTIEKNQFIFFKSESELHIKLKLSFPRLWSFLLDDYKSWLGFNYFQIWQ